jgi:hypothetical protein
MCGRHAADVPRFPVACRQVPRKRSRSDYAMFTQRTRKDYAPSHASFTERPRSDHETSAHCPLDLPHLGSTLTSLFPRTCCHLVCIEETPWTPILYVWVTDATQDPYRPTVGFLRTRWLPSGSGVDKC